MSKATTTIVGIVCAIGSVACGVMASRPARPPSGLEAQQALIDVGEMKQQEEKEVLFTIKNPLGESVVITDTTSSCTCTSHSIQDRTLAPRASTTVKAMLRSGDYRGRLVSQLDLVYRRDSLATLQRLPLQIQADVKPHYLLSPDRVTFKLGGGDGQRTRITLTPAMPPSVAVLNAVSDHPAIQILEITKEAEFGSTAVDLEFRPGSSNAKECTATIWLVTDSKMEPKTRVPVSVVSADEQ
ncbi:MAG: DUF1573 domain-containing protein [Gemmataceae bacterium]